MEPLLHQLSMSADVQQDSGADISPCGLYRYSLWRRWDYSKPAVLFVMLNPSTADADKDDQTIRKCIGFAQRWGAGGIRVVNLYAYRATDKTELTEALDAGIDPVAQRTTGILNKNDSAILAAASDADRIIAAWGSWPGPIPMRTACVQDLLRGRHVEALKLTQHGHPWHPCYAGYDCDPVTYWGGLRHVA